MGAPFAFALVLATGPGAAALVAAASCALFDLAHRKPARKVAFNAGTHTIGLAAGAVVWMALASGQDSGSSALPAILTGTAVFVAVKGALFAGAVALDETVRAVISPGRVLRQSVLARDDAERTARRGGRAAGSGDAGDGRPPGAAPAGADRAAAAGGPVRQRPGELPGECAERVQVDAADLLEEAATEARAGACGDLVVGDGRGLGSSPAGRSRPDPPLRLDALA